MSFCRHSTILILLLTIAVSGCTAKKGQEVFAMTNYTKALERTAPETMGTVPPGSEDEKRAIDRFMSFYAVFSGDVIKKNVRDVYADNAYFRDGTKEVEGLDDIAAYFLKSADTVHTCTFDIKDIAVHDGNYYFRWIMHLTTKRWKDQPMKPVGMSHVRFNGNGKIVFHQDYWDSTIIYEKAPIVGTIIRWIKKQF